MSTKLRITFAAMMGVAALAFSSPDAAARSRYLGPVTLCGPGLQNLCPINGYFDSPPFEYHVAIHPQCIQRARVATPTGGTEYRRVLVCDWPVRPMLTW